eukprot:4973117-Amphidinium_carterae.2
MSCFVLCVRGKRQLYRPTCQTMCPSPDGVRQRQVMAPACLQAFLSLVNAQYWKQIENRDLRPGSEEAKILLTSIQAKHFPESDRRTILHCHRLAKTLL